MAKKKAPRKAAGKSRKSTSTARPKANRARKAARGGKKRSAAPKRRPAAKARTRRPSRPAARPKARKTARPAARPAKSKKTKAKARTSKPRRQGGTGRESTLAQTPATGRSVGGRTNPMPTKRSTGTPAGAGDSRVPGLQRERRQLRDVEESVAQAPSSLNMDRHSSAARTGRANLRRAAKEHTNTGPALTGGDIDADWEDAYSVGEEAPGGENPTPDQGVVDDIGRALGVEYQDNEELKGADKISDRDAHRWELDPASAEDYPDHDEDE
jgi:hypothetical protein